MFFELWAYRSELCRGAEISNKAILYQSVYEVFIAKGCRCSIHLTSPPNSATIMDTGHAFTGRQYEIASRYRSIQHC